MVMTAMAAMAAMVMTAGGRSLVVLVRLCGLVWCVIVARRHGTALLLGTPGGYPFGV